MRCAGFPIATILVGMFLAGCGGEGNGETEPLDVQFGHSIKTSVYELQTTFQQEGLPGLQSQIEGAVENLQGYASDVPSDHQATFDQIISGVNELQTLVNGSPTREQITEKISSLIEISKKLPGDDPAQPAGG